MKTNRKNKRYSFLIPIFIVVILYGCGLLSPENELPDAKLELSKTIYEKGEQLSGVFSITNNTDDDMQFNFSSSCQFGLRISNGNGFSYEYPFTCAQVSTNLVLKSKQKKDYEINIDLRDNNNQLLNKGSYEIEAYLISKYSINSKARFEIK